jgi:hypothetical protein
MYTSAFCSVGLEVYDLKSPNLSLDDVYQYLKIYVSNLKQISLHISIFEILSCVLSCCHGIFCKFIPPFSLYFSKSTSFQNFIYNYLSTNRLIEKTLSMHRSNYNVSKQPLMKQLDIIKVINKS